jgi:hypothetical protein
MDPMTTTPTTRRRTAVNTERPKANSGFNLLQIRRDLAVWYADKQLQKAVAKRVTAGAATFKEAVQAHGDPDEKGNIFLELIEPAAGIATLKAQKATSTSTNQEEAEKILRKKGVWADAIDTVEVLNTDKVFALFYAKKITKAELDRMFHENISYSLILLDAQGKQVS